MSNLNGFPLDKDGNGFISKLSRDGKLLQLEWIEGGMNAPKGMVMKGHTLWVSDINRLHEIDTVAGKLLVAGRGWEMQDDGSTKKLGNLFTIDLNTKELKNVGNGMPVGNLGGRERDRHDGFYVTDSMTGKLYRIKKDGSFEKLLDLEQGSADIDMIDKGSVN